MCVDITEMRELQTQLTSIGLLVGSISHGIKGLLTGLDGGIYMVNSGFEKDKPERVKKGWDMVQRNVERIRSMVLDILYYAKDRELTVEEVDLAALVGGPARRALTRRRATWTSTLDIDVPAAVGSFPGDVQAIRAMLLNLLENSLDACRSDRRKEGHRIRVAARRMAPWMIIEVEDNGIGMDRETRDKAFSLFFSSKGLKGTGLGLFISNKIVDKHGGEIKVESEPGQGIPFRDPSSARRQAERPSRGVLTDGRRASAGGGRRSRRRPTTSRRFSAITAIKWSRPRTLPRRCSRWSRSDRTSCSSTSCCRAGPGSICWSTSEAIRGGASCRWW